MSEAVLACPPNLDDRPDPFVRKKARCDFLGRLDTAVNLSPRRQPDACCWTWRYDRLVWLSYEALTDICEYTRQVLAVVELRQIDPCTSSAASVDQTEPQDR